MFKLLYLAAATLFISAFYYTNPYLWMAALILFLITRMWQSDHKELNRIQSTLDQQNSKTILDNANKAATEFKSQLPLDIYRKIIFISAFRLGAESILKKLK